MKHLSIILITLIGILCLVQAGAALTTEGQIQVTPPQVNSLKPGDVISEVSGVVRLPQSGEQTFDPDDTVEFFTQLDGAKWSISIVVGGIENPPRTYAGKHATIGGYDLAYPANDYSSVKLKFSMTDGTVPASFTSGNIILTRVLELDQDNNQVGAAVHVNGTVISTEALQANASAVLDDITALKAEIDAKSAAGVDVTLALQKYEAAKLALQNAKTYLSTEPENVQPLINTATANIQEGNIALDQAWAGMTIQQADTMINSVNGLITEFKVNRSLKESDTRLVPIINKYDLAARTLSSAKNLYEQKSYAAVRSDTSQSLAYATEAWNLSLDLKTELDKGFSLPGLPNLGALLPFLLVAAVILIIVGVIVYRRKMHWDELG
jgi:hypothetical protein